MGSIDVSYVYDMFSLLVNGNRMEDFKMSLYFIGYCLLIKELRMY